MGDFQAALARNCRIGSRVTTGHATYLLPTFRFVETTLLAGYTDRISTRPGDTIKAFIHAEMAEGATYQAGLVRLICGDVNPAGPGFKEVAVASELDGQAFPGERQLLRMGSFGYVTSNGIMDGVGGSERCTIAVALMPTGPSGRLQGVVGRWSTEQKRGFALALDENGRAMICVGGSGGTQQLALPLPLATGQWHALVATIDLARAVLSLRSSSIVRGALIDAGQSLEVDLTTTIDATGLSFIIGALGTGPVLRDGVPATTAHFNGRVERPRLYASTTVVSVAELLAPTPGDGGLVAAWNLHEDMTADRFRDVSGNALHGSFINGPARAVRGFAWDGSAQDWKQVPANYGAVHFHDDDVADAAWTPSFSLTVPADTKSGVYALKLAGEDGSEDYLPFAVRSPSGKPGAKLAFLLPTASYIAYANWIGAAFSARAELSIGHTVAFDPRDLTLFARPEFGRGMYDYHSDGTGVMYSTRLRPILNMRPKYMAAYGTYGSPLWQFNADLHIVDWLEAKGIAYDVLTDEDLHIEGVAALDGYDAVMTGSHPEYHSTTQLDALDGFIGRGGRLIYLGGNGFYWRVAYHPENPARIELRRAEGGWRVWAAEPGEYYHSYTGEYGGLWKRCGRPPNVLAGIGFSGAGMNVSTWYNRQAGSFDARAAFVFDGVAADERIGAFGLKGGGAAGIEIDRYEPAFGSPKHALVLARSELMLDTYNLTPDEILTTPRGTSGATHENVHADLVFFETGAGGAVFSTGSIAWAGSLSHNNYDNNISRITENVVSRFVDPAPFQMPPAVASIVQS